MKKNFLVLAIFATALSFCKKEDPKTTSPAPAAATDTTPPVITVLGKTNDTIYLQNSYTDPGATVIDETDGNITSSLKITGAVNSTVTGQYILNYNAKDAAGNQAATKTRTVTVLNGANFLTGNYKVACSYTAFVTDPNYTPTVTTNNYNTSVVVSSTVNNGFTINSLNLGPINVSSTFVLNGNSFGSFYYNSFAYPQGSYTSTLSASKNSFTIETTTYDQSMPARLHYATNVFTKQ